MLSSVATRMAPAWARAWARAWTVTWTGARAGVHARRTVGGESHVGHGGEVLVFAELDRHDPALQVPHRSSAVVHPDRHQAHGCRVIGRVLALPARARARRSVPCERRARGREVVLLNVLLLHRVRGLAGSRNRGEVVITHVWWFARCRVRGGRYRDRRRGGRLPNSTRTAMMERWWRPRAREGAGSDADTDADTDADATWTRRRGPWCCRSDQHGCGSRVKRVFATGTEAHPIPYPQAIVSRDRGHVGPGAVESARHVPACDRRPPLALAVDLRRSISASCSAP